MSGSSTLLLSREASEKLAGRFFSLRLKPLTFQEFLGLKGVEKTGAEIYSRGKEINILLKNGGLLPIEVKETVNERDIAKFSKLVEYVKAERGIIVSLNQEMEKGNVKVVPAYMIEPLLTPRTP